MKNVIVADPAGGTITGTTGDDLLRGLAGDDLMYAGAGNDNLHGNAGDDRMYGGNGDDNLNGGSGEDILFGENGDDRLSGASGDDDLRGGDGDDLLLGQDGKDILTGGAGADTFVFSKKDTDETVFLAGITADNADTITDLSFAEGDAIRLEGFSALRAASGISGIEVNDMAELAMLVGSADSVSDFQNNSLVLTITDDDDGTHIIRLMGYSELDFL